MAVIQLVLLLHAIILLRIIIQLNKNKTITFIALNAVFIAQVLVGPSIKLTKKKFTLNITWLKIPTGRRQTSQVHPRRYSRRLTISVVMVKEQA